MAFCFERGTLVYNLLLALELRRYTLDGHHSPFTSTVSKGGLVSPEKGSRMLPRSGNPLSSEYGTYKTVEDRLWPWLSGKSPYNVRVKGPGLRVFYVSRFGSTVDTGVPRS